MFQPEVRKSKPLFFLDILMIFIATSCLQDSNFFLKDENENNIDNLDYHLDVPAISRTETGKSRYEMEKMIELSQEEGT